MADYHPLIARAVAGLDANATGESRRALYERARSALIAQLRGIDPPLSEAEITRERLALEDAIRKVEAENVQRERKERPRAGDTLRAGVRPRANITEVTPDASGEKRARPGLTPRSERVPLHQGGRSEARNNDAPPASDNHIAPRDETSLSPAPQDDAAPQDPVRQEDRPQDRREDRREGRIDERPQDTAPVRTDQERAERLHRGMRGPQGPGQPASPGYGRRDAGVEPAAGRFDRTTGRGAGNMGAGNLGAEQPGIGNLGPGHIGGPGVGPEGAGIGQSGADSAGRPPFGSGESMMGVGRERPPIPRAKPVASRQPKRAAGKSASLKAGRKFPVMGVLVLGIALVLGGLAIWQGPALYQMVSGMFSSSQKIAQGTKDTGPAVRPKIADRVGQPASSQTVAPVAQRVVLYEEDPAQPQGKQYVGTVVWRTEEVAGDDGKPAELAVRADVDIPERNLKMTMSFRRNTNQVMPASHTVELNFVLPPNFDGTSIANVPGLLMKSNEQARGTPLAGLVVKVTDNFFLIGLSNVEVDRSRNLQLLKERSWFDVPVVYGNDRRAIIAIEKGEPGERAFQDAFRIWGE